VAETELTGMHSQHTSNLYYVFFTPQFFIFSFCSTFVVNKDDIVTKCIY